MNNKIDAEIRSAVAWAADKNLALLKGGARFVFDVQGNASACDPLGAVLLKHNKVKEGFGKNIDELSHPSFIKMISEILEVDAGWQHRFYMGYDRGYQVTLVSEKDGKIKEFKDDVSNYGISLMKDLFKKKA